MEFTRFVQGYAWKRLKQAFRRFEVGKGFLVEGLYQKRGKYAGTFIHSGMVGLLFVGVTLGPVVLAELPSEALGEEAKDVVLGQVSSEIETILSEKPRAEVVDYTVQEGDTLAAIGDKFGVSLETVLWTNGLTEKSKIKPGQILKVPPVTGVVHTVRRGETIQSIAKKYDVESQNIVNWPFNEFVNDETFALAVGQTLVVPEGVMPATPVLPSRPRLGPRITPDAGSIAGTGQFVWPTQGKITQSPVWYHMALDIANREMPDVVAADSGTVIEAGWPDRSGYGNRVIIDHGNGFQTLYAHMSQVYVRVGQGVARGVAVGKMGSTGRSSGIHLHFEVREGGVLKNPWNYLQ